MLAGMAWGVGYAGLVAACGLDTAAARTSAAGREGDDAPQPGGVLRVGALGNRAAIERDPHQNVANDSDYLIACSIFAALTVPGVEPVVPRLATEWEASDDLTSWKFTIADGATFHDGSPVTSADVVWSLRRLRGLPNGAFRLPGISVGGILVDSPRSIVIEPDFPNAEVPMTVRLQTFVYKANTDDPASAPGTGPFMLVSYDDGDAVLERNPKWHGGEVLLDRIEVRIFTDAEALTSAVLGGQVDLAMNVGPLAARLAEGRQDLQIVRRPNDLAMPIVMRIADGPFADPRVRQAVRLAVDRPRLVANALNGYGTVANDILGTGDPLYARDLPQRARDLDEARRLLGEAGFDTSQTLELFTTSDVPGLVETATLFATQLADIGLSVKVVKQDSGVYYDQTWLKAPLYTTYWGTNDSVTFFVGRVMLPSSTQNETAWNDPRLETLYRQAVGDPDEARRAQAVHDLQRLQYEEGGYVVWGMADGVDIAKANVRGLPQVGGYGRMFLEKAWISA